jgi:putative transposase
VPWTETTVVDQRKRFIEAWLGRRDSLASLSEQFGISRKTAWKWTKRFYEGGSPALADHSRRPLHVPHAISEEIAAEIVAVRKRYPLWGPRKLRAWLLEHEPQEAWPAPSTIGALLKQRGLVLPRRRRIRTPLSTQPLAAATDPNVVWCTDFKGCFRVGGQYCHPLTISDGCSRFLLRVQAVEAERFECVQPVFESAFREYGMPWRMRSDNGAPFASKALGGLSRLSVWWVRLGITPERIVPGHPEQNGRHERMHRTLKEGTAQPPRSDAARQQRAFDEFREEFNQERPHEALGQKTPASRHELSRRPFPERVGDPEYPSEFELRRTGARGELSFSGKRLCMGETLTSQVIGIEEVSDGCWQLWFGPIYLGTLVQKPKRELELHRNVPTEGLILEYRTRTGNHAPKGGQTAEKPTRSA